MIWFVFVIENEGDNSCYHVVKTISHTKVMRDESMYISVRNTDVSSDIDTSRSISFWSAFPLYLSSSIWHALLISKPSAIYEDRFREYDFDLLELKKLSSKFNIMTGGCQTKSVKRFKNTVLSFLKKISLSWREDTFQYIEI